MVQSYKYKVATQCFTYNHNSYIIDTLTGFAIQQTSFPVVYIILDDASNDGEQDLLRDWAETNLDFVNSEVSYKKTMHFGEMLYAVHKNNPNAIFAILLLSENHYQNGKDGLKYNYISEWCDNTEYIAICEGDDYWIDPLKLQKQVDFMDRNPEHSLCFCSHKKLLPSGEFSVVKRYDSNLDICPMEDIILGGGSYMATNSMLYRQNKYVPWSTWAVDCPIGDLPLMLTLANMGYVGFIVDAMCVYRILAMGSWTSRMASNKKIRDKHHRAIIKMWHQFDKWSERRYHKIVSKKIWINRKGHIREELSFIVHKLINK